jgi:hypothetical protein
LKDQKSELNTQGSLSIIGHVDNHISRKDPIGLTEDPDLVTAQMRIIGSEGSPANVLSRETIQSFP